MDILCVYIYVYIYYIYNILYIIWYIIYLYNMLCILIHIYMYIIYYTYIYIYMCIYMYIYVYYVYWITSIWKQVHPTCRTTTPTETRPRIGWFNGLITHLWQSSIRSGLCDPRPASCWRWQSLCDQRSKEFPKDPRALSHFGNKME